MSTEILPAAPPLVAAMAAMHAAAFPSGQAWDEAAIAALLGLPGCFGLVHRSGGMLLARVIAGEAELLTLAVAPSVRRRCIGATLLRRATAQAAAGGAAAMFLEVSAANAPARALYAASGFRPAGRRAQYYPDGSDALVLRAALTVPGGSAAG